MTGIVHHVGALGYTATLAAYESGKPWQEALIRYLRKNREDVKKYLSPHSCITLFHSEASYLAWIDAREMRVDNPSHYFQKFKVGLYDGTPFEAPGFLRLNFACPNSVLQDALSRIIDGIEDLY